MLEIKKDGEVPFTRMVIYMYKKLKELGTVERNNFIIMFSYIEYCMRYIGNRCLSEKVVDSLNS